MKEKMLQMLMLLLTMVTNEGDHDLDYRLIAVTSMIKFGQSSWHTVVTLVLAQWLIV